MAKILLVEDDSNLREIYGARLEAEGYQIISANDGEEALAIAVREQPDLIISDIMMPKISGFDMLDILRSTPETRNVKVIVMTALSQDDDRKRGEQLGADRYVVKSQVTLDDVVLLVREVLGQIPPASTTPEPDAKTPPADASANSEAGTTAIKVTLPDEPAAADATPPPAAKAEESSANPEAVPTEKLTPADAAALTKEVEQFVATSPLMNGVPPQPVATAPEPPASPTPPTDTPAPTPTDEKPPVL